MEHIISALPARTIWKIRRDTEKIRRLATFIIVLDKNGVIKETIRNSSCDSRPVQPIIAVLAPTRIGEEYLSETLVFEMTWGRAVPYHRIEENLGGDTVWIPITKRLRVRMITEEELRIVWTHLEQGILSILKERLYYWRSLGELFWLSKSNRFHSGVLFRCSSEDTLVFTQFYREHLRYRRDHLLDALRLIAHYKKSYYTDKQLGNMRGACKFADILLKRRVVERRYIVEYVKSLKLLAERICEWAGIPLTDPSPRSPTTLLYDHGTAEGRLFPSFGKISLYFREKQREKDAKDCFSVEIIPKRMVIAGWRQSKREEVGRYWQRHSENNEIASPDIDNIPFTPEEVAAYAVRNRIQPVTDDGIPF